MSSPTEEAPKEVDPQPSGSTAPAPAPEAVDPASPETPVKRGRGRPKGSKNRKNAEAGATPATVPKKRGRPPKEKKPEEETGEPAPKRKRGRPSKAAKAAIEASNVGNASGSGDASGSAPAAPEPVAAVETTSS